MSWFYVSKLNNENVLYKIKQRRRESIKVNFLKSDWSVCHRWLVVALTGRSLTQSSERMFPVMSVVWQIRTTVAFRYQLNIIYNFQVIRIMWESSVYLVCVPWVFPDRGRRWCVVVICGGQRTASPPTAARCPVTSQHWIQSENTGESWPSITDRYPIGFFFFNTYWSQLWSRACLLTC